ncbi:MAG: ribosomal protein S18-alanine N-acetyltransferase [Anaerolineales bacterium]|nr:ribosomal protein S18-alanine N-acetyltransferase [Anaerolineales bacterium]
MQAADVPRVVEIDKASFTLPWSENSYLFEVEGNEAAHCYLAESLGEKKIVGIAVAWLLVDTIHIATVATDTEYRRRGVSETILRTIFADLIQLGAKEATLEVRESNIPAQTLYKKLGFEIINIRPNYYSDNGEAAYLMTIEDISSYKE